jgi:putative ABC transport system permease protein
VNIVALKMLVGDRLKYFSLVAGLAFAALLVTQQGSIFTGYSMRVGAWIRDTNVCDLWVMDSQAEFTEANMPMLDEELMRVRGIDGVAWAVPLQKNYLKARLPDGTRITVRTIGLDDASLTGGPPEMVEGKLEDLRRDRTVIMNADAGRSLMMKSGLNGQPPRPLRVGDSFTINETQVTIVGSYRCTTEFFWEPVFYTTRSRSQSIAPQERRQLSYVMVKAKPGVDLHDLAYRIREKTGLKALTPGEFDAMSTRYLLDKTGILVNFGMTIALGFLIGVLVAGQTLYAFMLENMKHFAAIKAMGATNGRLVKMVFLQVLVVGLLGYGLGLGAASITGILFKQSGLAFQMPWQIPVVGAFAIIICCLVAGLFSMIRVLRLEPAVVFKG